MKRAVAVVIAGLCLVGVVAKAGFLEENTKGLRLDAVLDGETFDSSNFGLEAGFSTSVYPLDELGLFVNGTVNSNQDRFRSAGLFIEENYPIALGLVPYAGVGVGYGWQDLDSTDETAKSAFGRVLGGVHLVLSENFTLSGALRYAYALDPLFLEDDRADKSRVEVTFGFRFYY